MLGFILKRLGLALLVALAVSAIAFFLLRLSGDVGDRDRRRRRAQADIELIRQTYGLDRPLAGAVPRLALADAAAGDFGQSLYFKTDVASLVLDKLPTTLILGLISLAFALADLDPARRAGGGLRRTAGSTGSRSPSPWSGRRCRTSSSR